MFFFGAFFHYPPWNLKNKPKDTSVITWTPKKTLHDMLVWFLGHSFHVICFSYNYVRVIAFRTITFTLFFRYPAWYMSFRLWTKSYKRNYTNVIIQKARFIYRSFFSCCYVRVIVFFFEKSHFLITPPWHLKNKANVITRTQWHEKNDPYT